LLGFAPHTQKSDFPPILGQILKTKTDRRQKPMIEHGPVDVIVVAAGEPRFNGAVLAELERQVSSGTIRLLTP
jgi:hypothetical protein